MKNEKSTEKRLRTAVLEPTGTTKRALNREIRGRCPREISVTLKKAEGYASKYEVFHDRSLLGETCLRGFRAPKAKGHVIRTWDHNNNPSFRVVTEA